MGWLFSIYTMLTFVAIALYGGALLQTHLLAAWGAWIVLIYGIAGLVVFLITRDCPPAIHSIITFLIGLLLLFGVRS